MKFSKIISNSFKYPFSDKGIIFPCLLFVLAMILPFGIGFKNEALLIIGGVALLIFIFIFPGYMLSVVKNGSIVSFKIPKINFKKNFIDTFKLIVLDIVYGIIPAVLFFILIMAGGLFSFSSILNKTTISVSVLNSFVIKWGLLLLVIAIIFFIFSILQFVATARLARYDSLSNALNFAQSYRDIRNIGVLKVLGVYLIIPIICSIFEFICLFALMFIPAVGFLVYFCIILPIICLIYSFSLGLLYSDGSDDDDFTGDDFDFDKFEKELENIKYRRFY